MPRCSASIWSIDHARSGGGGFPRCAPSRPSACCRRHCGACVVLPYLRSPVSLTPATERETAEKLHIDRFCLSKTTATCLFGCGDPQPDLEAPANQVIA